MILSSVLGKRKRTTYAWPVEDREAPCTGLAATPVAEATTQPAGVVGPTVVVEEGIDTVGWPSAASAVGEGVGEVDCSVSDTVAVTVEKTVSGLSGIQELIEVSVLYVGAICDGLEGS
jgi:hypothetical protein